MSNSADLSGSLGFLSLAEILQLLGANGSTGVLRLRSPYAKGPAFIYLQNGNPINASYSTKVGLDAAFAMFGLTKGDFEFVRQKVQIEQNITKSRMEIILDGLRNLDEGKVKKAGPIAIRKESGSAISNGRPVPLIKGPLIDYMYIVEEETYQDGEKIVESGRHGNWVWAILEGAIDIVKDTPKGPVTILRLGDGAFVGSLSSFLVQSNVRSATAVAVGNVQLGVIDSQRMAREFAIVTPGFKDILTSLDKRLKQVTHRAMEYLKNGHHADKPLRNAKPLMKQGAKETRAFKIVNGEISIVRETAQHRILLSTLSKGDFLGKVPFLDIGHEPYSASVFASEDIKLRTIDPEPLHREFQQLSTTFRNFIESVATCVSATTNVACG